MFIVSRKIKQTFYLILTDREPPRIANCPDVIYKTSEEKWTKIFFPVVTVTDNVGVHSITLSRQNGSELTWGQHNVTYTASDIAGNTARCHFQVIIGGMYSSSVCQYTCFQIF